MPTTRRAFLQAALIITAGAAATRETQANAAAALGPERRVRLTHARTGEAFDDVYFADGLYQDDSIDALDRLMRDHHVDEITPIDVRLYDLLALTQTALEAAAPFLVTSGYRTRATNNRLRLEGRNPAQNSLHLYGMAADVFMEGVSVRRLERAALTLRQGGVGAYPRAGFVHLDVGRVRRWRR